MRKERIHHPSEAGNDPAKHKAYAEHANAQARAGHYWFEIVAVGGVTEGPKRTDGAVPLHFTDLQAIRHETNPAEPAAEPSV